MAEDTRADADSHFVNGLDYLITLPYCGGRIVKKMPLRQFLSFLIVLSSGLCKSIEAFLLR